MMLGVLLALADAFPLGALPPQDLAPGACALFLWRADAPPGETPPLLLMATPDPPRARILLERWTLDLPRTASGETDPEAPRRRARYEANGVAVTLDLALAPDPGQPNGARVPSGTLALDRAGGDSVVVPVAGLVGCAKEG